MAKIRIYYWDSSCFIAFFKPEPHRVDAVTQFLDEADAGEVIIVTSFMTITEVLRIGDSKNPTHEAQQKIIRFFQKDYFEWVNFDRGIAERARDLMWKHDGLKSKDAVHIASAVEATLQGVQLNAVHAYDGMFSSLSGKIDGLKCKMEHPIPPQLVMPLGDVRKKGKNRRKKSN